MFFFCKFLQINRIVGDKNKTSFIKRFLMTALFWKVNCHCYILEYCFSSLPCEILGVLLYRLCTKRYRVFSQPAPPPPCGWMCADRQRQDPSPSSAWNKKTKISENKRKKNHVLLRQVQLECRKYMRERFCLKDFLLHSWTLITFYS